MPSERDAYIGDSCRTLHAVDITFQAHELQAAMSSKRCASGEDRISYSMLFHGEEAVHAEFLRLANLFSTSGSLPTAWKCAVIAPIPKPNAPEQFRPISLLSCVGKTLERMVLARLKWALGPLYLFAFHRGTSISCHACWAGKL